MKWLKRWYLWLYRHYVGMLRFLYLAPIVVMLVAGDKVFQAIVLFDCAMALTYSIGNSKGWYKEDNDERIH